MINATIFMIALPSFVGLALIAEPLIGILLGEAWQGAAIALALLCVARGLASCSQLVMPVLSLAGESRALPKLAALMTAINLGFIAAFAWKGLPWAAGAQIVASVVAMPLILRLLVRHGGIAWDETLKEMARTTACVAIMAAAVLGVGAASERYALLPWQSLAAMIAAGFIAYALALLLVRPLPVRAALQRLSA